MKTKLFLLPTLLLILVMLSATCSKEDESNLSNKIGSLVSVFEIKPGDTKEIIDREEKIVLSIKEIKDSVLLDCSLVDFGDNKEAPLNIRIYSYLQINDEDIHIELKSKPCGALQYKNDGNDIQEILDQINDLESAPANLKHDTYYTDTFINLFGEGSTIKNSPFKIFMAKAFPVNYEQPDADINDYKFIFIITRKN